jgi:hypothetical protein
MIERIAVHPSGIARWFMHILIKMPAFAADDGLTSDFTSAPKGVNIGSNPMTPWIRREPGDNFSCR